MSFRTTAALVATVIEVDETVNDGDLTPFIRAANELVTEHCGSVGLTDSRLQQIETWLAAHFYTVRDPRATSEGVSGLSVSYQSSVGKGLAGSHYGQTAMSLDTSGRLSKWNRQMEQGSRVRFGIFHLGTTDE